MTPMQYDDGSFLAQKAHTFANSYYKWDADKTRGCVCDPEYGDVDCSKKVDIVEQGKNVKKKKYPAVYTRLSTFSGAEVGEGRAPSAPRRATFAPSTGRGPPQANMQGNDKSVEIFASK